MRPVREQFRSNHCAYFVSTQTIGRRSLFQTDHWAALLKSVLEHNSGDGYVLHAWVIMPDHLHLLLTPNESIEKAVQLIKGGFSFRVKRELGWLNDVWQQGFTDHRIRDNEDWEHHLDYIHQNPVDAGLSVDYPWMGFPNIGFPQGLKPLNVVDADVRAEARTLHPASNEVQAEALPLQSSSESQDRIPQGLKPHKFYDEDVRAKARTLHPSFEVRNKRRRCHAEMTFRKSL